MTSTYHAGLLVLRLGMGGLMLTHGVPKFMNLIQGNLDFGDPIGIGSTLSLILTVVGEAICPLLIIIGYRTRLASIPAIITMAVAVFVVHGADPIATKEKALLYLVGFMVIALTGAGKFSVDRK